MTMTQPKEAFNQVKAILGKLDRSITEARSKRLGEPIDEPAVEPAAAADPVPAAPKPVQPAAAAPPTGYAARRAQYGRAKPVQPRNDNDPQGTWISRDR
jgi:hypothetical protein